jgi:hypothetical protein
MPLRTERAALCLLACAATLACKTRSNPEGAPAPPSASAATRKPALPLASAIDPGPALVQELFPGKQWRCFFHAAPDVSSDSECFRKEEDCASRRDDVTAATPKSEPVPSACSTFDVAICLTIHTKATGGLVHCTASFSSCRAIIERAKQADPAATASDCIENP